MSAVQMAQPVQSSPRSSTRTSVQQDRNSVTAEISRDGEENDKKTGQLVMALTSMLCACACIYVTILAWQLRKSDFYTFSTYGVTIMGEYDYIRVLVFGAFFSSLGGYVATFILATGAVTQKTITAQVGILLCFVAGGVMAFGGYRTLQNIDILDTNLKNGGVENSRTAPVGTNSIQTLQDWSTATYQDCCIEEGLVNASTAPIKQFASFVDGVDPDEITDESIYDFRLCDSPAHQALTGNAAALQPCIYHETQVFWFQEAATDEFLCGLLKGATVTVEGVVIAGQNIEAIVQRPEVTLVDEAENWGCGGGKLRAFQGLVYVWFQNSCRGIGLALLITGIVFVLVSMLNFCSLQLSGSNRQYEVDMDVIDNYVRNSVRVRNLEKQGANSIEAQFYAQLAAAKHNNARSPANNIDDKL
mmetsp:Transcript_10723/g.23617  ORF Transcript_10723/g.23617 Transcript_10723/m.23617 type:complete len:417 (-) Transcript_10723:48-1298(-)